MPPFFDFTAISVPLHARFALLAIDTVDGQTNDVPDALAGTVSWCPGCTLMLIMIAQLSVVSDAESLQADLLLLLLAC